MWTDKQIIDFFSVQTPENDAFHQDDMGVELEIEFTAGVDYLPVLSFVKKKNNWVVDKDGSLRGVSYEFITPPADPTTHFNAFISFEEELERTTGYSPRKLITASHRTSTHVHLNFNKDGTMDTLKFIALYYLFEQVLIELADADRKHNTFCVSSNTIPFLISDNIVNKRHFSKGITDKDANKYASLNFSRFLDLGTIESRIMHGYKNALAVSNWLCVLKDLKVSSRTRFKSLTDINNSFLNIPCTDFLAMVFPKSVDNILTQLKKKDRPLKEIIADGYRSAYAILQNAFIVEEGVAGVTDAAKREEERRKRLAERRKKVVEEVENAPAIDWNIFNGVDPEW